MNSFVELTSLSHEAVLINVSAIWAIHPTGSGTAVHLDGSTYHVGESYGDVKNLMREASIVNAFVKMDR